MRKKWILRSICVTILEGSDFAVQLLASVIWFLRWKMPKIHAALESPFLIFAFILKVGEQFALYSYAASRENWFYGIDICNTIAVDTNKDFHLL